MSVATELRRECRQVGPSHPQWNPNWCGKKKKDGTYCVAWRQNRADGSKMKHCHFHSRSTLYCAENWMKTGQYSYVLRAEVGAKFEAFRQRTDLLNLEEELALFKTYFSQGLTRWQEVATEENRFEEIQWVMTQVERLSKLVETIVRIRNDTALTVAEIHYLQVNIARILKKYLTEDQLRPAIEEIFSITETNKQSRTNERTHQLIDGEVVRVVPDVDPSIKYIYNANACLGKP